MEDDLLLYFLFAFAVQWLAMLSIFFSLAGLLLLLLLTEYLWQKKHLHVESARKIIHISSGVFIAFWPLWMSWNAIIAVCALMFLVILISRQFKIFNSIHGVSRLTRGELLYPLGIGLAAYIAPSTAFFWIAVLNLALADGLAAVVGNKFGIFNGYSILGHKKSVAGTMACFVVSSAVFSAGIYAGSFVDYFPFFQAVILFPLIITGLENISWYGLDNLTVPLGVILLLGSL
jgi:phytol kinase